MLSINALDRGNGLRRAALGAACASLHAAAAVAEVPCGWLTRAEPVAGTRGRASLVRREGLTLLEAEGDPEAIGADAGALLALPTRRLLRLMGLFPPVVWSRLTRRAQALGASVSAPHRAECEAWARVAGVAPATLLAANAIVDTCCSALVAMSDGTRPLMVARNMDFFPAAPLGRATCLSLLRPRGALAVAAIGWPGYGAVISGLNEAGLSACILLNYASSSPTRKAAGGASGTPIAYRVRELLERARTVDEAAALFAAAPVASSHYLLLADAHQATLTWQHGGTTHRHDPHDGWLACSNGRRDAGRALADDDRGRCLLRLAAAADPASVDDAWMRGATTATYLAGINAQAMVLIPQRRTIQVAVGSARAPAATARWVEIDLTAAFAGSPLADCPVRSLAPPAPWRRYTRAAATGAAAPEPGASR